MNPKDIPGFQIAAPLVVGVFIWFGLHFAFLAPSIITPRIADRYYFPQCRTNIASLIEADQAEVQTLTEAAQVRAVNVARTIREAAVATPANILGSIFAQADAMGMPYDGANEFMERYGQEGGELEQWGESMSRGSIDPYLGDVAQREFNEWQTEFNQERAALRAAQKFTDANSYCACNWELATEDAVAFALHSASLRLYRPAGLNALERGKAFVAECGQPPVI